MSQRHSQPPEQAQPGAMISARPTSCRIESICSNRAWPWQLPLDKKALAYILKAMAESASPKDVEIQIRFISDAEMALLNARYLACEGPTNVITFPQEAAEAGGIAISLDSLRRESLIYGQNPEEYLIRLLAHGFGHLQDLEHGLELDVIQDACEKAGLTALAGWRKACNHT